MQMRPAAEADLMTIRRLYRQAFPLLQRAPFGRIARQWRRGCLELVVFEDKGTAVGFSINAVEPELVLVDYLAMSPAERGRGFGGEALGLLRRYYARQQLFLIIEHPQVAAENQQLRQRRLQFYQRHGYIDSGLTINGAEGRMQLLVDGRSSAPRPVSGEDFLRLQQCSLGGFLLRLAHIHVE